MKVLPRSSRNALVGVVEDALKVQLTAPPVRGAANAALLDFLAGLCDLPKRNLVILSGHSVHTKRVRITGLSVAQIKQALGMGAGQFFARQHRWINPSAKGF